MNKYYQKIKLKKSYNKKIYGTYNKRIKRMIKDLVKRLKEIAMIAVRRIGIYLAIIIIVLLLGIIFTSFFAGLISNITGVITVSSYQSGDIEITDSENYYNHFEADLLYAIDNVEVEHSGYDEYRYYVDTVGHNPHEIIAYLTAKFGEFRVNEVRNELSRIFDEQYTYQLTKVVETRHKTVTTTSIDPITGETITTSKRVSYKWNVLKISLDTKYLESILLSKLDDKEEELYITLMETKGNFQSLISPIKEDWKNSVSSMFGYRLDPFTGEVEFHTGIDIGKPLGTELVAIIDGIVLDIGYDNGYGKYIILKNDDGQTALYGHCNNIYVDEGIEIHIGEIIGEMGSTGNSTGSHLHLEIRDSNGNRLNPYFYLSSEIVNVID
jgi:murein DD-endopeptidase MepM/ murein hydrolase activator NlpD